MKKGMLTILLFGMMTVTLSGTAWGLDAEGRREFDRYMNMTMAELTEAATDLLDRKYPDERWEAWNFPGYVFIDQATETSYKIAVKEPRLLGLANLDNQRQVIPCYCTCESFGHANLLYCFWQEGRPGGAFDEHGSQCAVCIRQAFLAFLWNDLGADHAEIMQGMEKKFAPLIKLHREGQL